MLADMAAIFSFPAIDVMYVDNEEKSAGQKGVGRVRSDNVFSSPNEYSI